MNKIIITDKELNEEIIYQKDECVDVFIERFLRDSTDPDSYDIKFYEISKEQVEALKYLEDTDWWITREVDRGDLTQTPDEILEARETARSII